MKVLGWISPPPHLQHVLEQLQAVAAALQGFVDVKIQEAKRLRLHVGTAAVLK